MTDRRVGLCGRAGVWWPLRAWPRASRGDVLAPAYLALILPASLRPPGAPVGPAWLGAAAEAGSLLVVPLLLPVAAAGGGAEDVAWVAGPYAALLLLGAALTFGEGTRRKRPPARAVGVRGATGRGTAVRVGPRAASVDEAARHVRETPDL